LPTAKFQLPDEDGAIPRRRGGRQRQDSLINTRRFSRVPETLEAWNRLNGFQAPKMLNSSEAFEIC